MSEKKVRYETARVSEHEEQANFVTEANLRHGSQEDFVPALLFAVPNGAWFGGKNPFAMYNKFKAEGFKPGVSDLLYLQPRGEYAYLAIEMKAIDKRRDPSAVSQEQADFLAAVNGNGGTGEVCYGAEEALRVFEWYMSLPVKE